MRTDECAGFEMKIISYVHTIDKSNNDLTIIPHGKAIDRENRPV